MIDPPTPLRISGETEKKDMDTRQSSPCPVTTTGSPRTQPDGSWQTGKPPHGVLVEVMDTDGIHRVRAVWGSDGVLPHWESEDRDALWSPSAFGKWREVR
jgi:hypothetical protein